MRSHKHTEKKTREAIRKQIQYLRGDLSIIDSMLAVGLILPRKWQIRLETLRKIYEQQKFMYDNHTHSVPDRIVSVSQPFIRPIVRGKAGKPVEFGAKLEETVGFTLAMSIVVLNLRKLQRILSRLLLQILHYLWPQ